MFSDCLRAGFASSGIGMSTICPGIVRANMVANTQFCGLSASTEADRDRPSIRLSPKRHYTRRQGRRTHRSDDEAEMK